MYALRQNVVDCLTEYAEQYTSMIVLLDTLNNTRRSFVLLNTQNNTRRSIFFKYKQTLTLRYRNDDGYYTNAKET